MHRLRYESPSGGAVELDAPGAWSGAALGLRGWEWSYALGWRSLSGASLDAREAEIEVSYTDPAAADLLRRLSVRDLSRREPGRVVVDGEWYQRAYLVASAPKRLTSRGPAAAVKLALLDGTWRREVVTRTVPVSEIRDAWLDYPHGYEYDYGGAGVNMTVTVGGLVPAPVRIVVYGPATDPVITATLDGVSNVYQVAAEVPAGAHLDIDGASFPKSIRLVGEYGDVTDLFAAGERGDGEGSGRYCFQPLPPGTSSLAWDGSFGFDIHHYEEEGEPPWS